MSQAQVFRIEIGQAIENCLDDAKEYRINNNALELPSEEIERLVAKHIDPLCGEENKLNVPLYEGKNDWRRHATELAFRKILAKLARTEQTEQTYARIVDCLDFVLFCSSPEHNLMDSVIQMITIEEILDVYTTQWCEKLFGYIERRKTPLTQGLIPNRGKSIVLLRMCNELLRRLSKETNTVFCGRILMFLANAFSLAEKSGVNINGSFNNDMLNFDADEEVDADPDMTDDEKEFYKTFWTTRVFFANPLSIFVGDNFDKFIQGTNSLVQKFQIIAKKDQDTAGARKSEVIGMKRDRSESSSVDLMEEDPVKAKELLVEINREFQFPRLLSSRKLMDLEMEDVRFRRNIIVQNLVLLQYLRAQTAEEQEETRLISEARKEKPKPEDDKKKEHFFIPPNYKINEAQIKWLGETRDILETLLRSTKPHGNLYTEIILTILKNERHWILWKASGCPAFEKEVIKMEDLETVWQRKEPRLSRPPKKYLHSHGHPALSNIYGRPSVPLARFMQKRSKVPTVIEVIDHSIEHVIDMLDQEPLRFQYANGAYLQVCRLIYREHPHILHEVYEAKKKVYKEMRARLKEQPTTEGNKTTDVTDFPVNEEITNDHVEAELEALRKAKEEVIKAMSIKIDDDGSSTTSNNDDANGTTTNGTIEDVMDAMNAMDAESTTTTPTSTANGTTEVNGTTTNNAL